MTSENRIALAREFVLNVAQGGIAHAHFADEFTVWTTTTGLIEGADYLPRMERAGHLWLEPLAMTIETVIARHDCVVLTARSHGVLFTGDTYGNDYLFVIEFDKHGKINHVREHYDAERLERIFRPALNTWQALTPGR